jgi:hypothetical protein
MSDPHDAAAEARLQAELAKAEHQKPKDDHRKVIVHDDPTPAQLADDEAPEWVKQGKDAPPGWRKRGDRFEEEQP